VVSTWSEVSLPSRTEHFHIFHSRVCSEPQPVSRMSYIRSKTSLPCGIQLSASIRQERSSPPSGIQTEPCSHKAGPETCSMIFRVQSGSLELLQSGQDVLLVASLLFPPRPRQSRQDPISRPCDSWVRLVVSITPQILTTSDPPSMKVPPWTWYVPRQGVWTLGVCARTQLTN
jgi:hypothetical protein